MQIAPNQVLLIINSGSSSLKFAIYRLEESLQMLYRGEITAIGTSGHFRINDHQGHPVQEQTLTLTDHEQAMARILDWLDREAALDIIAAGHRVVHGGARFHEPVLINDDVMTYLETLVPLAPNHQPASLQGINALQHLQPGLMQIACFDTAFHHDRPAVEQRFALPARPELDAVRRYGFHGLSYEYIARVLPDRIGTIAAGKIIVAHLGHGASLCAMQQGRSVATSMTFTPLDGIPMGTRCGSIDPAVVLYLLQQGMSSADITDLLYFQSGLLGVSGCSDDMTILLQQSTPQSQLAIEQFVHHSVRTIGSLAAALGGLDVLVFTAGIGEHAAPIRAAICKRCEWLGLELDTQANHLGHARISQDNSLVQAWVIATNEEQMIAEQSLATMQPEHPANRISL